MNLTQLLTHYNVRFDSNETLEICLDDFVQNIAECKPSYVTKIKDKTKRNGLWYKDAEVAISDCVQNSDPRKQKNSMNSGNLSETQNRLIRENPNQLMRSEIRRH